MFCHTIASSKLTVPEGIVGESETRVALRFLGWPRYQAVFSTMVSLCKSGLVVPITSRESTIVILSSSSRTYAVM